VTEFAPDVPHALSTIVRRVVANNPGAMTGPGTNTYLVGVDDVAVIDPGPDDPDHADAIVRAASAEQIRWILLTHLHGDHAPGASRLRERTCAEWLPATRRGAGIPVDRRIGEGA